MLKKEVLDKAEREGLLMFAKPGALSNFLIFLSDLNLVGAFSNILKDILGKACELGSQT